MFIASWKSFVFSEHSKIFGICCAPKRHGQKSTGVYKHLVPTALFFDSFRSDDTKELNCVSIAANGPVSMCVNSYD